MNFNEGNYRITFKDSSDVVMLNGGTKRMTYWRARGEGHSLRTLFQTKVHQCEVGSPLLVSAQAFEPTLLPSGVVASVEASYHPEFAPDCLELFGPVSDPGEPLTPEQLANLFEPMKETR